jgi:hypothetical protein
MLSYNEQYQILAGIHYAFANESKERVLCTSHSPDKIQKMKMFMKHTKYESTSKQNFIIICLYTELKFSLSSLHDMMTKVSSYTDADIKEIYTFKNKIVNYRLHLSKDIEYINNNYGGKTSFDSIILAYRHDKINWFTMYYYGVYNKINLDKVKKSRRFGKLIRKIETLLLYITFSDKTVQKMMDTLDESLM